MDLRAFLDREKKKEYFIRLMENLEKEYEDHTVYPPRDDLFNALFLSDPDRLRVVIMGQDPYHEPGQAHGLAFSVLPDCKKIPPSLRNIYKELEADVGIGTPRDGCLTPWAKEGVLLLNSVLSVREGEPKSHDRLGWQSFTDALIRELDMTDDPLVFMLWGKDAEKKKKMLKNPGHLVLCAAHPSPLSANRGFFGCRHFSRANEYLVGKGARPVNWELNGGCL